MTSLAARQVYPLPPSDALRKPLVGQSLQDIPTPAAIIDLSKARRNCSLMLDSVKKLGVKFRAHVKTHKTSELTRLQVGADCKDVRLIVSTVIEAEQLVPLLRDYQSKGAKVNVLYGVPLGASHVERLASIGQALGPGSISTMIDHPDQLKALQRYATLAGSPASIFIKVDTGTSRAGISPASSQMQDLVSTASDLEEAGVIVLQGFYSHAGHSYGGSSPDDAMGHLMHEISTGIEAAKVRTSLVGSAPLTISVGASPTILSVQNLFSSSETPASRQLASLILQSTSQNFTLELHAGVYPLLDMQQNATHARPSPTSDIALTVLVEVSSLYPNRTPGKPEALISAGCLALAREPCKDYSGWGVVTPWGFTAAEYDLEQSRMIVARISQEHGILAYEGDAPQKELPLLYGQKLRIWPNHACITGACYGFYIIVDSSSDEPNKVVDVWLRWRGW